VHAPVDAAFGRHPVTVRYAAAVDRLRTVSGESSRPGLEIQLNGVWRDDRRVLRPGPVHVDGVHRDYSVSGSGGPEPAYGTVSVPLDDAESARKVKMSKPIVAVRGPWEIPFSVPS